MLQQTVKDITDRVVEPLCEETARLFRPLKVAHDDRLHIALDDEGRCFIVHAYRQLPYIFHWTGRFDETDPFELPYYIEEARGSATWVATSQWITRLPERTRQAGSLIHWKIAATDFTVLVINAIWPHKQVVFDPDARIVYDYLLHRFVGQTMTARERATFKIKHAEPEFLFRDNERLPLAPYQRVALKGIMGQEGSALFMEQGTGKTPVVIARICNEAEMNGSHLYRALIVAPKNVRTNWRNEFSRFATVPGKVAVLRGGQLARVKLLVEAFAKDANSKWVAIIASYETVSRSWEALRMIEWDLVVLDESHYIKSPRAKRTKKMLELRACSRQRMVLTGTPITNSLLDLFTQLEFLDEGQSGFLLWETFRQFYGKFVRRKRIRTLVSYKNVPLLQERLARIAFMIQKTEALPDLPPKMQNVEEVEMSKKQFELYCSVRDQLAVEIKEDMENAERAGRPKQLTVNSVLTKLLRLAQITSGFIVWDAQYSDDGEEVRKSRTEHLAPNPKLEMLVKLLKEKGPTEKTVVWACWVADIVRIQARLEQEGSGAYPFMAVRRRPTETSP